MFQVAPYRDPKFRDPTAKPAPREPRNGAPRFEQPTPSRTRQRVSAASVPLRSGAGVVGRFVLAKVTRLLSTILLMVTLLALFGFAMYLLVECTFTFVMLFHLVLLIALAYCSYREQARHVEATIEGSYIVRYTEYPVDVMPVNINQWP
jgi:hypothetical protein